MTSSSATARSLTNGGGAFALALLVVAVVLCTAVPPASAKDVVADRRVGVDEQLGKTIPEGLTFKDEEGKPVDLTSLFTKPTILTLVWFRCPSICSPLMREVAHTIDEIDNLTAGEDFNLVTVSFDHRETPEMARNGRLSLLNDMEKRIPLESWRFLTGDKETIEKLTDIVGFRYYFREDKQEYVHPGTVIFVTKDGKIVRYLGGLAILPFDMTMAINDAAEGTPRSFIQKVQQICYGYDPEGRKYVFQVNKIILYVSLLGLGIFLAFLLLRRKKARVAADPGGPGDGAPAGGHA